MKNLWHLIFKSLSLLDSCTNAKPKKQQTETGHLVLFVYLGNHPEVQPPTSSSIPNKTHPAHLHIIQVTLEFQLDRWSHFTKLVNLCDHFTIGQFQGPTRSNASLGPAKSTGSQTEEKSGQPSFWCEHFVF